MALPLSPASAHTKLVRASVSSGDVVPADTAEVVLSFSGRVREQLSAVVLTGPAVLAGHAASAGSHRTAQAALVVHVGASVLWVGGVVALALVREVRTAALRFSPLALGCALLVGLSGVAGAYVRLGPDRARHHLLRRPAPAQDARGGAQSHADRLTAGSGRSGQDG